MDGAAESGLLFKTCTRALLVHIMPFNPWDCCCEWGLYTWYRVGKSLPGSCTGWFGLKTFSVTSTWLPALCILWHDSTAYLCSGLICTGLRPDSPRMQLKYEALSRNCSHFMKQFLMRTVARVLKQINLQQKRILSAFTWLEKPASLMFFFLQLTSK